MPLRDDDDGLEPVDDLLALDRKVITGAANERIAGGMYARIARDHAELGSATARTWQRPLVIASLACAAVVVLWFMVPKKNVQRDTPRSAQLPVVARGNTHDAALPSTPRAPRRSPVHSGPRFHPVAARAELPRPATFPVNVIPTEQERLLSRVASQHPEELLAMAQAMAATRNREEAEKREFDQWLQEKGGGQ